MEFHFNESSFSFAENDTLNRRVNVISSNLGKVPTVSGSLVANSTETSTNDYVYEIIYPILLFIATAGNGLTLVILGSEKLKRSLNVYLMTVAFADLSVMWLELPRFINEFYPSSVADNTTDYKIAYAHYQGLGNWSQKAALLVSEWTLIAFSLDRLFAIVKPFSFRNLRTAQTARIVTGIVLFLALIETLQNVIAYYYLFEPDNILTLKPETPALERYRQLDEIMGVLIIWIDFLALLIINVIIIGFIQKQRHSELGKMRTSQQANSQEKYRNSYMLLMSSALLYLVCQLPSAVFYSMLMADSSEDASNGSDDMPARFQGPYPFVRVMFCLNYSVTCYLYLLVSKRFRDQLISVCKGICGPIDMHGKPKKPSFQQRDTRKFSLANELLPTETTTV